MGRLAIFVDAGYLWVQTALTLFGDPKTSRKDITLDYEELRGQLLSYAKNDFPDSSLLRVYWYDGPDKSGMPHCHKEIVELDDFKLRLGTRNSVGQQKGVDGLIIADLISLTQNRAITDALLVSGDADLAPGVIAAQNLGLRVHLLSLGNPKATSPYLAAEMDRKQSWTADDIKKFANPNDAENIEAEITKPAPVASTPPPPVVSTPAPVASAPAPVASAPTPSADTPDIEHATEETLLEIAKAFFTSYPPEKQEAMIKGAGLPRRFDIPLLKLASEKLERLLVEEEKRSLRNHVKRLASEGTEEEN